MHALVLLGCFAPLVDERVIGVDVPAELSFGPLDSRLGTRVDATTDRWAATGEGFVRVDGTDLGDRVWAGFWGDSLIVADVGGQWWVDDALQGTRPGVRRWAAGPAGVVSWDGDQVLLPDGAEVPIRGVSALHVGAAAVYAVACEEEECAAVAWAEGVEVARWAAGAGGDVGEWEGEGWAGDPMLDEDEGPGRVCTAAGRCVEGQAGDHLGLAVGGGYAGGTFSRHAMPPRARFVPLGEGPVYALEVGAETQPHALAGDGATLVVGAPYYPHQGGPSGLVAVVPR